MTESSKTPFERFAMAIRLEQPDDPDLRHIENMRFDLWIGEEQLEAARETFVEIWGDAPLSVDDMRARLTEFLSEDYAMQFADGLEDLPADRITAEGVITMERLDSYWEARDAREMAELAAKRGKVKDPYRYVPDMREVTDKESAKEFLRKAEKGVRRAQAEDWLSQPRVRSLIVVSAALAVMAVSYVVMKGFAQDQVIQASKDAFVPTPAASVDTGELDAPQREPSEVYRNMVARGDVPEGTSETFFDLMRMSDGNPEMSEAELTKLRDAMAARKSE
jgi:hypothetical protein